MTDLTVDFAAWGQAYLEGITLAREHVNSSSDVGGKSVELDIEDTRFNPALTAPLPVKVLQVLKGELEVAR